MSDLGPLGALREATAELTRGLGRLRSAEAMCVRDSSEQWMQREEAERDRDRYREALEEIDAVAHTIVLNKEDDQARLDRIVEVAAEALNQYSAQRSNAAPSPGALAASERTRSDPVDTRKESDRG